MKWGVGVGLTHAFYKEVKETEMIGKVIKKVTNRMRKIRQIPLENEHTCILGLTRHGKTYAIMQTLSKLNEGCLFFNVQHEETPKGFIKADMDTTKNQLKSAIRNKQKINYVPSTDIEEMQKELSALINMLYEASGWNMRLVVDEVHLMKKTALGNCIRVATTGLRHGIKAVWLSQRPANVDNTLYSQSTKFVIFALGKPDINYLKNHGFPVEEFVEKTQNEKYRFVIFDSKDTKGAFMIG